MTFGQRRARLAHLVQPVVPARPVGGQACISVHGMRSFTGRPLRAFQALAAEQARLGLLNPRRFEPVRPQPCPAVMMAAAIASDAREAFPSHYDADEASEGGIHTLCAAELALAQD